MIMEEKRQINYARQKAVRDAWAEEKIKVQQGQGTRDWSLEEQKQILEKGQATGYHGHHMKSVSKYRGYTNAGDCNIQFLTPEEHRCAHDQGITQKKGFHCQTNGYYNYQTGKTEQFLRAPHEPPHHGVDTALPINGTTQGETQSEHLGKRAEPMTTLKTSLSGWDITHTLPTQIQDALVAIPGQSCGQNTALHLAQPDLLRGTLVVGSTGMGKTVFLQKVLAQLRKNLGNDTVYVIVEAKNDYEHSLGQQDDLILGQGTFRDRSVRWNLFEDLLCDGWDEEMVALNCAEFAAYLFREGGQRERPLLFPCRTAVTRAGAPTHDSPGAHLFGRP